MNVATADNHVFWFKCSNKAFHGISDITTPLFFAIFLQASNAQVVLKSGLFVRQMPQLERFDNAVHDRCRSKTCPEAQKEHLATLVAAQSLHGRVVDDFDREFEGGFKVETFPTFT